MECFTAIASGAVSKLGELAVDLTVNQFKYMIQHDKIVANLKEEHSKLKAMKTNLQEIVDGYRRNELEVEEEVLTWLRKVEEVDNELKRFYAKEANKNNNCFGGKCPNLAVNYSVGKRATKKTQCIADLKEKNKEFTLQPCPKSPPRLGSLIPDGSKALESRKVILKDVVEKLKDERLKRISICGMGGVGKTTLVDQVIRDVEATKLFDRVAKAAVSQNPDYGKIQIEIADRLQLNFRGNSIQERALELHERMNEDNKRVLIVLDDVWAELDFCCIGLPSLENQKGCKIIFTSRDEKVCQKMGSQETIRIQVLSEDEAWYLFREMAGDVVDTPNINNIAKDIAKECGGLPLALVTVARALAGEQQPTWETAREQLKDSPSSSVSDMQKLVYSRIEKSINFLSNEELKCCLMLCGLFPEDFDIPIESLLRLGMGIGMFKVDGARALLKTRNLVHTLIGELKRCFLLLDSDKAECVKMHDVVRDVVISIASKEYGFVVQYSAQLKSPKEGNLDDVKAISLILDETMGLENALLEYPTLQLLQVRSKSEVQNSWPQHFFQDMKKLKVLVLENLSIPTIPSFFKASANLHTLQVQYCDVGDISVIGKELKNLQVLSFAHSNIKELPIEIGELCFLKLLDLRECDDLYFISTNVFGRLTQLQELYFGVRNFPWIDHKDVLMELQSISNHLKALEFTVRNVETLPKDLTFKNADKYWVCIMPYPRFERRGYLESNTLEIGAQNYKSIKCSLMMKELLRKCEILELREIEGLKNVICELDDTKLLLSCLKDLSIKSCPNIEYVFDGTGPSTAVPQIQSLYLCDLENLREICNASDHHDKELTIKFLNLVELYLESLPCLTGFSIAIDLDEPTQPIDHEPGLSNATELAELTMVGKLFSSKWIQNFPKLETLELWECDSLEMIFDLQGTSQLIGQSNAFLFPHLKQIGITWLNKLTYVWGNAPINVQGFQNLRSMKIYECASLRYIFTPAIVRAITKLEELEVSYCKLMENLVDDCRDEEEVDHKDKGKLKITFHRLYSLSLYGLPNLTSICPKSYDLELPSIRKLSITDCPKVNISSLLNQACTKQNNVIATSNFDNNSKENHSNSANWHFGCITPFCCRMIRPANKIQKNNEEMHTMLLPHDQVIPSNLKRKTKKEISHMPNLEELDLRFCQLSDELFEQEGDAMRIRHYRTIDEYLFPKLTSLYMESCNKIRVLLSPSSLSSLECLEKIILDSCEDMKEIISQEESEGSANKITLPKLQDLILQRLPSLMAFSEGSYHFDFPSLIKVRIEDCDNMEVFSRGSFHTPNLDNFEITGPHGSNYIHKGDLNTIFQGYKAFVESHKLEMLSSNSDVVVKHFTSISQMDISNFHKLLKVFPVKELHEFQHVRKLMIEECDSLVEVFESSERGMVAKKGSATIHYEMESMELKDLPKLKDIWGPNIMRHVSFDKLASVTIKECNNLKSVLSHSMARSLSQLKTLCVSDCDMMEHIFTMEDEFMDNADSKAKTPFPKLVRLELERLPKLECVCSRGYCGYDILLSDEKEEDQGTEYDRQVFQISFPQLEQLYLDDLPGLKCFCPGAYDYDPMLSSYSSEAATFPKGNVTISTPNLHKLVTFALKTFRTVGDVNLTIHYIKNSDKYKAELQKLETFGCLIEQHQYQHLLGYITRIPSLELEGCDKLLSCVPCNMMHSFQHLRALRVLECEWVQEIFESNECDPEMELLWMELHDLPKLKHIWRNVCSNFTFHELSSLTIRGCHNLKFVFPDVSICVKSLQNLELIEVKECDNMEEIIIHSNNKSVQRGAKIIFPRLDSIVLKKLPKLTCFCPSPSSFHFELPQCSRLEIEECPKMETFCYGTLYTPCRRKSFSVGGRRLDKEKDVNEAIQEI